MNDATTLPTFYVAGWNLAGYMPEMEPDTSATAAEAKAFILGALDVHGDHLYDGGETDLADEASALAEDLNLTDVQEGWTGYVGNEVYWIIAAADPDICGICQDWQMGVGLACEIHPDA